VKLLLFSVIIILLSTMIWAASSNINIGIVLADIQINSSQKLQVDLAIIDTINNIRPNLTFQIPVSYFTSGLQNISIGINSFGLSQPFNITINESGFIKNGTIVGDTVTWEADLSVGSATIIADVRPPGLKVNLEEIDGNTYRKNFTVLSNNSFTNVSVHILVNPSYQGFSLFQLITGTYTNKSSELNLNVTEDNATFYGFNTSQIKFSLAGICTESWSCGDWSDVVNSCGTRTCTDANACGTEVSKPITSDTCPIITPTNVGGRGRGIGISYIAPDKTIDVDIAVDPRVVREFLVGDESIVRTIAITNTGTVEISLTIDFEGIEHFAVLPEGRTVFDITLEPRKSVSYDITFDGSLIVEAGVYSGDIVISDSVDSVKRVVEIILEYEIEVPIFDVLVNIPERYRVVIPGQEVIGQITLINLRPVGRVDVVANYFIRDIRGQTVATGSTTVGVENEARFDRSVILPEDLAPGNYIFGVVVVYDRVIGVGSDVFEVRSLPITEKGLDLRIFIVYGVAVIVVLSLVMFQVASYRRWQQRREIKHKRKASYLRSKKAAAKRKSKHKKTTRKHKPKHKKKATKHKPKHKKTTRKRRSKKRSSK